MKRREKEGRIREVKREARVQQETFKVEVATEVEAEEQKRGELDFETAITAALVIEADNSLLEL